jgi:hypothetical protein
MTLTVDIGTKVAQRRLKFQPKRTRKTYDAPKWFFMAVKWLNEAARETFKFN